ncbi:MAG TPA: hypothetical protein VE990_02575 [Acidimicrobiales bacterium]|nr:hypothetical protein [Acidimicrobiales bacterium]
MSGRSEQTGEEEVDRGDLVLNPAVLAQVAADAEAVQEAAERLSDPQLRMTAEDYRRLSAVVIDGIGRLAEQLVSGQASFRANDGIIDLRGRSRAVAARSEEEPDASRGARRRAFRRARG